MIQRVQSIYLLLAGVAFFATFLFRTVLIQEELPWMLYLVVGLNAFTGLAALVSIFFFSDRKRQRGLVSMLQYMALVAILVSFAGAYLSGGLEELVDNLGAMAMVLLPLLGFILIRWADRKIRKDIELIRSMDRLR